METRRRCVERQSMTEMQRIMVRGALFKRKDKLMEEGEKYLNPDSIAIKIVVSLGLGAWFLFLRILSFGYPLMTDAMLANSSLRVAGIIMWLPVYAIAILIPWLAWALARKAIIKSKIKHIDALLEDCKPCFN